MISFADVDVAEDDVVVAVAMKNSSVAFDLFVWSEDENEATRKLDSSLVELVKNVNRYEKAPDDVPFVLYVRT